MAAEETLRDLLGSSLLPDDSQEDVLNRIVVVGAGQMGLGIAHAVSAKGLEVLIVEKSEESLVQSMQNLEAELDRKIARWAMTESDKRAIMSRITSTVDLAEIEGYRIVIESVPDDMAIKTRLFRRLDTMASPHTVLVTNTSTLSVTELAEKTTRPERVIGMHFLHPVPKRPLVEIVRGLKTSDETFSFVESFARMIGKSVVEVYESPGYVTTRVILPMLNEAMYALMEGVANAEGIDTAMRYGYDFDYGPLSLADQMGLDEVMKWMETMFRETGDQKYRPCPLLRKLVRAGHLGVKTQHGFFLYDENGRPTGSDF
ncbi:3-hydroxybutyryl-CoA dehydrogenase [bacterium]|nr:3-hydroxybutyryl-CoA dehydrogenase [bacterium]